MLDVGAGGLEGENTSQYLLDHFGVKNVTGICRNTAQVELYQAQRAERQEPKANIIIGDFYTHQFNQQFDLVVLDLNIESNVEIDWTPTGLEAMRSYLKPGGILINYVMLTEWYGDENETPALIRKCWKEFYGTEEMTAQVVGKRLQRVPGYRLFAHAREKRRPYILWVALQKI